MGTFDFGNTEFRTFEELLDYVGKVQKAYKIKGNKIVGTQVGTLQQFKQLNIPSEQRHHEEVMIVYHEPISGEFDPLDGEEYDLQTKSAWFNKFTRKRCDPPEWFLKRKEKLKEKKEN